ncbi:MAG: uridine kinase [Bdellovibrionota bacterium]
MVKISQLQITLFEYLYAQILSLNISHPIRIGIDGVDGSGKTNFADSLADYIHSKGRHVIRSSTDHFHNPRETRYQLGKSSPEGFFKDSFNLNKIKEYVLDPLSQNGSLYYKTAHFDHRTDGKVDCPTLKASNDSILIFDGIFIHRDELVDYWDYSIFLDVSFSTTFSRMSVRDRCPINPEDPLNQRYLKGQEIYLSQCSPMQRASVVIDNEDWANPKIKELKENPLA